MARRTRPPIRAPAREPMRACSALINPAVRSPSPASSLSARAASARANSATWASEKSKKVLFMLILEGGAGSGGFDARLPPHEFRDRFGRPHPTVEHRDHAVGNGHRDTQMPCTLHDRACAVNAFGHVAERIHGLRASVRPWASSRPTLRLRDRSPVAVRTRSPRPDRPMKVSTSRAQGDAERVISARPRVMSAARALRPSASRRRCRWRSPARS